MGAFGLVVAFLTGSLALAGFGLNALDAVLTLAGAALAAITLAALFSRRRSAGGGPIRLPL